MQVRTLLVHLFYEENTMQYYNGSTFRPMTRLKFNKMFGQYPVSRNPHGKRISFENAFCAVNPYVSEINGEIVPIIADNAEELILWVESAADDI